VVKEDNIFVSIMYYWPRAIIVTTPGSSENVSKKIKVNWTQSNGIMYILLTLK